MIEPPTPLVERVRKHVAGLPAGVYILDDLAGAIAMAGHCAEADALAAVTLLAEEAGWLTGMLFKLPDGQVRGENVTLGPVITVRVDRPGVPAGQGAPRRAALAVVCPACGALGGLRCIEPTSGRIEPLSTFHQEREDLVSRKAASLE